MFRPAHNLQTKDKCLSVNYQTKFRAEPRGPLRGPIYPCGVYSGLRRPVLSLRDQGAAPPLRLGVLALPGDGGHLTDFVANLWSIGAIDTTHKTQAQPNPWFLSPPQGPEMSFPLSCLWFL